MNAPMAGCNSAEDRPPPREQLDAFLAMEGGWKQGWTCGQIWRWWRWCWWCRMWCFDSPTRWLGGGNKHTMVRMLKTQPISMNQAKRSNLCLAENASGREGDDEEDGGRLLMLKTLADLLLCRWRPLLLLLLLKAPMLECLKEWPRLSLYTLL